MEADFVHQLTAQSTLAELPAFDVTLDLEAQGELLGNTFTQYEHLPGVVVTDAGQVRGSISRGQYLRLVSRHLGREVYHPRPIRLMFDAVAAMEEPLLLGESTPIQDAVGRALERPRELIYEPVIVRAGARGDVIRLVDFQDLLMADSRISILRNQQMGQILSTVQEGFLLVDQDRCIATEYSRSIQEIFATKNISGRPFEDLLLSCLGAERAELGRGYLETLFNPNVIEKLVTKINPLLQVVALTPGDGHTKHLAFRFTRVTQESAIRRILVRVEDVTRAMELSAELEVQEQKAKERVDLVFDIVRAEPASLAGFLKHLHQQLDRGEVLLGEKEDLPMPARLEALFRGVHALKGEAGMLGMRLYQSRIHQFEDGIVALREGDTAETADLTPLRQRLDELRTMAQETHGLLDQFRRLGGGTGPAAPARPSSNGSAPAPKIFEPIHHLVEDLATRHGKSARFYTQVDEASIPETYRELLRQTLIQLARNALVHGLETPQVRKERGKPEMGTLQFAAREHPQQLEYIVQDDGGGLDLEAIRQRAVERGMVVSDDSQLPTLIFESGFSTAAETTLDAGRGVGMDVVLAEVKKHGGSLRPHSQPGAWCAFQILLPRPATSQGSP